jgi:hypothetical protein
MRITWSNAPLLIVLSAFVACASPVAPSNSSPRPQVANATTSAAFGIGAFGAAEQLRGAGPETRQVTMMDACDGPTFNLIIGPGTCSRAHGVSFQEFVAELTAHQSAGAWHNAPGVTEAKLGDALVAFNNGGETHTFTRVANFGGGIVPFLNALAGTPNEAPECAAETTFVPPGGTDSESLNQKGELKFQCCVHPWMHTTVIVK